MIVDGWFDWAERRPGPAWKQYSEPNANTGYVPHSMEGRYINALAILESGARSSWGSSNLKDGRFIQHYPVTASTWTSGSRYPNTHFFTTENEGMAGEPLTDAQVDNIVRVIRELSEHFNWTPERPSNEQDVGASLYEHRECVRWGSDPTECPSDRIPWDAILARLEDDMKPYLAWDKDRQRAYLIGPFGAAWITNAADVTTLEGQFGKIAVAYSASTIDAIGAA